MLKFFIFYASYLAIPFLFFCCYLWWKKCNRWAISGLIALCMLFIYSRFIEPQMLLVNGPHVFNYTTVEDENAEIVAPLRIALLADMHVGIYKKPAFVERIIAEIQKADVDLVLIAGDFVHMIDPEKLPTAFEAYAKLDVPIYAVTGNHDTYLASGYQTYDEIYSALEKYNINPIDNQVVDVTVNGQVITLVGLSDLWAGDGQPSIMAELTEEENVILIAHNPDYAYALDEKLPIDLIVTGHTHGGQVRIPFVYKSAIPTVYDFDEGYYLANGFDVFVTAGTGEVGLPMRLGIPPRIDILEISF